LVGRHNVTDWRGIDGKKDRAENKALRNTRAAMNCGWGWLANPDRLVTVSKVW